MPVMLAGLSLNALAQDDDRNDPAYTWDYDPDSDAEIQVDVGFETEWHEYDNLDFRSLDESSDQAILDSDDRGSLFYTGVTLDGAYEPADDLALVFGMSHRGLWGNDQFGSSNAYGGLIFFHNMYVDAAASTDGDNPVRFRIGRQYFELGGLGGGREYILKDNLDMLRIDVPLGDRFNLTVIPMNVLSTSNVDDGNNFISLLGQSSSTDTFNFRGDRLTQRYGGVLSASDLGPLGGALYYFYTNVGARGTGADISYEGLLGNFSDEDYLHNAGLRANVAAGPGTFFAHVDVSSGIDRKELVAHDVDTNGLAYGAGMLLETGDDDKGFEAELSYFDALGPAYSKENGLQTSHGYVGMKASQMGGTISNRLMGWHPSAYAGTYGVNDTPHEQARKSGSRVIHASAEGDLGRVELGLGWWTMQDTGVTFFSLPKLDETTLPFGYSRGEVRAQERLGAMLGHEINLDVDFEATDAITVYANGATLLAGEFYGIEVARVAGTALGSKNPKNPWAFYLGTEVDF